MRSTQWYIQSGASLQFNFHARVQTVEIESPNMLMMMMMTAEIQRTLPLVMASDDESKHRNHENKKQFFIRISIFECFWFSANVTWHLPLHKFNDWMNNTVSSVVLLPKLSVWYSFERIVSVCRCSAHDSTAHTHTYPNPSPSESETSFVSFTLHLHSKLANRIESTPTTAPRMKIW